jgi:plasmid stability protein
MSPELHRAIRIEAAKKETSMEEAIYKILEERLLKPSVKKGGEDNGRLEMPEMRLYIKRRKAT